MILESNNCTVSKKIMLNNLFAKEKHNSSLNDGKLVNMLFPILINTNNSSNKNNISLSTSDITSLLEDSTNILISIIKASTISEGINHLVESILAINKCPKSYNSIIIHFNLTSKYKLSDISEYMNIIYDVVDEDINAGFCISIDNSINNIKITSLLGY